MKKIALLLTILCAGALNGMEPEEELNPEIWGQEQLPNDVKTLIMVALAQSGDNLDSAINNIKNASRINKTLNQMINAAYGNQEGFTALVHMLAEKFNTDTKSVAKNFKTPAAQTYYDLTDKLMKACGEGDINAATQLINQGADVNSTSFYNQETPLSFAINSGYGYVALIKLLLESGAKMSQRKDASTREKMKQLLEEARRK